MEGVANYAQVIANYQKFLDLSISSTDATTSSPQTWEFALDGIQRIVDVAYNEGMMAELTNGGTTPVEQLSPENYEKYQQYQANVEAALGVNEPGEGYDLESEDFEADIPQTNYDGVETVEITGEDSELVEAK